MSVLAFALHVFSLLDRLRMSGFLCSNGEYIYEAQYLFRTRNNNFCTNGDNISMHLENVFLFQNTVWVVFSNLFPRISLIYTPILIRSCCFFLSFQGPGSEIQVLWWAICCKTKQNSSGCTFHSFAWSFPQVVCLGRKKSREVLYQKDGRKIMVICLPLF